MISAASDFQFGRFGLGKVLNQLLLVVVHSMPKTYVQWLDKQNEDVF